MLLGRVIGRVVSSVTYAGLEAVPMLWIQPLDRAGKPKGSPIVAADSTRMAGPGELIYYEGGREAAMTLDPVNTRTREPGCRRTRSSKTRSFSCARSSIDCLA